MKVLQYALILENVIKSYECIAIATMKNYKMVSCTIVQR